VKKCHARQDIVFFFCLKNEGDERRGKEKRGRVVLLSFQR
jgi:hypothetical protein